MTTVYSITVQWPWCDMAGYSICMNMDGLVQDCGDPSALAMELPQSSTKPSICSLK